MSDSSWTIQEVKDTEDIVYKMIWAHETADVTQALFGHTITDLTSNLRERNRALDNIKACQPSIVNLGDARLPPAMIYAIAKNAPLRPMALILEWTKFATLPLLMGDPEEGLGNILNLVHTSGQWRQDPLLKIGAQLGFATALGAFGHAGKRMVEIASICQLLVSSPLQAIGVSHSQSCRDDCFSFWFLLQCFGNLSLALEQGTIYRPQFIMFQKAAQDADLRTNNRYKLVEWIRTSFSEL